MPRAPANPHDSGSVTPQGPAGAVKIQINIIIGDEVFEGQPFEISAEALAALSAKGVAAFQTAPPTESPDLDNRARAMAAKVLELLTALDPRNRLRKAPPIKVFNLYYRARRPVAEIARICKCHRSLVFIRLAAIRKSLPWSPRQLQAVSAQVQDMEDALTDSRAKRIRRKGAAYGDEGDPQETD